MDRLGLSDELSGNLPESAQVVLFEHCFYANRNYTCPQYGNLIQELPDLAEILTPQANEARGQ